MTTKTTIIQNNTQGGVPKIPPTHTLFFDNKEEKNNTSWGEFFFHPPESLTIQQGLDFMLEHFSSEPLWPRKVSTAATRREQRTVDGKDRAMLYYDGALREDCRIAGYGIGQTNPDLLFIELDAENFTTKRAFKLALTTTLKNIEEKIGGHPTVIWSGRGYHIIQPIYCPKPLEEDRELATLESNTSNKFLQFAERHLSAGRSDNGHHPALKSCMLRVPGSINSKCKELGLDPEVKLIQRWNKCRPDYRLLTGDFHTYVVGRRYNYAWMSSSSAPNDVSEPSSQCIPWIDILLQTPIPDWRKTAVELVLAPYLLTIKRLSYEQAFQTIIQWAEKCAELSPLRPSTQGFIDRVHMSLSRALDRQSRPMRWVTLVNDYSQMYEAIKLAGRKLLRELEEVETEE